MQFFFQPSLQHIDVKITLVIAVRLSDFEITHPITP